MEQEFIKATKEWYKFLNRDHHKDSDCHWFISQEQQFSYGEDEPSTYWKATHYGYILGEVYFDGSTRESVMEQVINFIRKYILVNN